MTGIPILERNRKYIIVINNLVDLFGGSDQPGDVCALKYLCQDARSLCQCIDEGLAQDDLARDFPFLGLFEGLLRDILALASEMHLNGQRQIITGRTRMQILCLEKQLRDFAYHFLTRTSPKKISINKMAVLSYQGSLGTPSLARDVPDMTMWEIMSEPNLDRDEATVSWSRLLEWSLSPLDESQTESEGTNEDEHNADDIIKVRDEFSGNGNPRDSRQRSSNPVWTTPEDIYFGASEGFAPKNTTPPSIMPASHGGDASIISASRRETWQWQRETLSPCPSPEPGTRARPTDSRERSYRSWLHLAATVGSVGCTVVELIILGNSKTKELEITFYIRFVGLGFQAAFLFCFCVWRLRNKLKLLSSTVDNWRPWLWQAQLWYAVFVIQFFSMVLDLGYFVAALNFIRLFLTSYVVYYSWRCWRREGYGDNEIFLV
jgi:hypothetical protein